MTTKHTPGPWHYHRHGGPNLYADDGTEIGHANYVDDGYLIAAAPDLLDACEKALGECCDLIGTKAGLALEAAIAKAKGETT